MRGREGEESQPEIKGERDSVELGVETRRIFFPLCSVKLFMKDRNYLIL